MSDTPASTGTGHADAVFFDLGAPLIRLYENVDRREEMKVRRRAFVEGLHLAVREIDAASRAARSGSPSTAFAENTFG
jgi:hypothetical protein